MSKNQPAPPVINPPSGERDKVEQALRSIPVKPAGDVLANLPANRAASPTPPAAPQQHEWTPIFRSSVGNVTLDAVSWCQHCGSIKRERVRAGITELPTWWWLGSSDVLTSEPECARMHHDH